jgi:Na+/H+ antiporter
MENYAIILVLLGIMVILSALAEKQTLSSPIVLIIAGIGIGFLPVMPTLQIDPEIIFLLFLPPLLYDASFNINFPAFKDNINTISSLAFGLVFLTTAGIAVISHYLIPGMTWPLSFVLGAILASTDAVAALSITKSLNLSSLTNTILEGESLLNDASALVAYRFAIAAVTGSAFIWWKASLTFILLLAIGAITGIVIARALGIILKVIRRHTMSVLSLTLLAPFTTYLIAEELHGSGVIAVVALGFTMSRLSSTKFPQGIRHESKTIWELVVFMLNGLIFILIGLELPIVVKHLTSNQMLIYAFYALILTLVAFLIRTLRVFIQRKNLLHHFNHPKLQNTKRAIPESILLSFQESIIISWSGMRGIVSLAVAIGLPEVLENGEVFNMKNDIIYITTVVVLISIIGQGLILPVIVKKLAKQVV